MRKSFHAALLVAMLGVVSEPVFAQGNAEARNALQSAQELYSSGNWETAREAYERALKSAPRNSIEGAQASLELSSLLWELGDYDAASKQVKDALDRAKKQKLDHAVGRLMLTMGHIEASRGQFKAAESTLRICSKSAAEQRDEVFESLCRINLRFVRQVQGKSSGSDAEYRSDLARLEKSGQAVLVGTALAKSAELQEKARDFAGALETLKAAQRQFTSAGSVPAQSRNKLRLAQAYQNLDRWDDARKELDGVLLTLKNMNNRPALVTAYALRGKQRSHEGEGFKALADLDQALSLSKELGSPTLIANVHLAMCEHHALANNLAQALEHCDAANKRYRKIGAMSLAARAQVLGARVAQYHQRWLQARERYTDAIETLEKDVVPAARDARDLAVQRANLCQVSVQLESNGAHLRCREAKKALEGVPATDTSYRQMWAATIYGMGVTTKKDPKSAREALETAASEWEKLGLKAQAAEAVLRMGKMEAEDEKLVAGSRGTFERALDLIGKETDAVTRPLAVQIRIQLVQRQLAESDFYGAKLAVKPLIADASALDDKYSQAWAYNALASAELKTKERDAAIAALEKALPFAKGSEDKDLVSSIERNLEKLKKKE